MATATELPGEKEPQCPKQWRCTASAEDPRSPKYDSRPLEKVYNWMKDYDQGMCEAWRDEIENLLIFATLLAATVTVFTIDSYKWLQDDNSATSTKLLAQISLQIAAMANNSTQPAFSLPDSAFIPSSRSVRVNIVWFLSLILCLSTVVLGILCLQWLREYTRQSSHRCFDAITVRHMCYEGLFYWRVPDLISFLSMALQASVLLFFGGVLDLLWSLHSTVAIVSTIAVGLLVAGLLVTALAPVVQSAYYFYRPILHAIVKQCPYKSPFSWLFLRLATFVGQHGFRIINYTPKGTLMSWEEFDAAWDARQAHIQNTAESYNVQGLVNALSWITKKLSTAGAQSEIIPEIFHLLHSSLAKPISHKTLQSLATVIDNQDHKVKLALSLDEYDPMEHKVQHDLLMAWFVKRYSFILNRDDLLMELRVRCLNTLIGKRQMDEMFDEVLRDYTLTMASSEDTAINELRFQTMATIIEYHRRDSRVMLQNIDLIGNAMAGYIRCTPVKDSNAHMCYEIHKRFAGLLEDIRGSMERLPTSSHDHTVSIYRQYETHLYPRIAVMLLGRLDLRRFEEWEKNIAKITAKQISTSGQLIMFLDRHILPALEAQDALVHLATQVRRQLDSYRSDTLETEMDDE